MVGGHLLPDEGPWYREWPIFSGGRTKGKTISREWDGEHAKEVKARLERLIAQYSD